MQTLRVAAGGMHTFVAIDFETATFRRDSACAVGVAAGCGGRVVHSCTYLIRPPGRRFTFTGVHDLRWEHVRDAPTFPELWPVLRGWIDGAAFVAAHNAAFDRSVLHACCARYRLRPPRAPFICTVQLARSQWEIRPTKLPDVCRQLSIPLRRHHDARADAEACARIVLAAEAEGWRRRGPDRAGRRRRSDERSVDDPGPGILGPGRTGRRRRSEPVEAPKASTGMGQGGQEPPSRALQVCEVRRFGERRRPRLLSALATVVKAAARLVGRCLRSAARSSR